MWFLLLLLLKGFLEWLIWFQGASRNMTGREMEGAGKIMGYCAEITKLGTICGVVPIKPDPPKSRNRWWRQ